MIEQKVLFEAHIYTMHPMWALVPTLVYAGVIALAAVPPSPWNVKDVLKGWKIYAVIQLIVMSGNLYTFFTQMVPYYTGNYLTVEGTIEEFTEPTNPYTRWESFKIGDVYFEYSPGEGTFGYHDTTKYGCGVLMPDMYVRISYVYNPFIRRNIIMRIATLANGP